MRGQLKVQIFIRFRSQREFAMHVGMSEDILTRIIRGKKDPTEREGRQILNGLGFNETSFDFLFQDWDKTAKKQIQ